MDDVPSKFYNLELSNGEKYIANLNAGKMSVARFKLTGDPKMPFDFIDAGEELAAAALQFIQQDLPYENSPRFPEDEEK